jgi:hypothetical protein
MHPPLLPERYSELGFPAVVPVSTLRSIAQLFGSTKSRCGIYLLEFPGQTFYIGQAVDVVRRFAQHRKTYSEISGFSFISTRRVDLNETERQLIYEAELAGLLILNTIHASSITGDTDLDLVISPTEQAEWLASPAKVNELDASSQIALPAAQVERFAGQFRKFERHCHFVSSLHLLRMYLLNCLPLPKRTEYSFWVATCLPSTNRNTWPRLASVSAGIMELLVLGYHKEAPEKMWGFVTVASDILSEHFATDREILGYFPSIEIHRREYQDAGQHQITLCANALDSLKAILGHKAIQCAAGSLALRVMRKRATIYSKFHCKQLAELALLGNG